MGSTFSEVNMNRLLVFLCALTSTLALPKLKDECQNCQQGVEKLFGNYVSQEGLAYQKEILYGICSDPIFDQVDCEIDIDLYWPKVASIIYVHMLPLEFVKEFTMELVIYSKLVRGI